MIFSLCQTHFILLIKLLIYLLTDSNTCLIYILIKHLSFYIDVLFFHVLVVVLLLAHASSFACQQLPRQICQNLQFQVVSVFILFLFFSYPQCVDNLLAVCCQYVLCVYVIFIYILYLFFIKKRIADCAKRFWILKRYAYFFKWLFIISLIFCCTFCAAMFN